MRRCSRIPLSLSLGLSILLAACTPDRELVAPGADPGYPFPETPDQLMENFVKAFEERNLVEYGRILHDDFLFSYQPCDVRRLGLAKSQDGRDEELATAANMFGGKTVTRADGTVVPAITAIRFAVFEAVDPWRPAEDSAPAGAQRATYRMLVFMDRDDGSRITIRGLSTFYASALDVYREVGGAALYHQLIGWVDLTEGCVE